MERIRFNNTEEIFVAMQPDEAIVRLLLQQQEREVLLTLNLLQLKTLSDSLLAVLHHQYCRNTVHNLPENDCAAISIISVFSQKQIQGGWNECQQPHSSVPTENPSQFKSA